MKKETPRNHRKKITPLEYYQIKELVSKGYSDESIANRFERTTSAITKFRSKWKLTDPILYAKAITDVDAKLKNVDAIKTIYRNSYKHITDDVATEIKSMAKNGVSYLEIAAKMGRSVSSIYNYLYRNNNLTKFKSVDVITPVQKTQIQSQLLFDEPVVVSPVIEKLSEDTSLESAKLINHGKNITELERLRIKDYIAKGWNNHEIAKQVGRTPKAISNIKTLWKKAEPEQFLKATGGKRTYVARKSQHQIPFYETVVPLPDTNLPIGDIASDTKSVTPLEFNDSESNYIGVTSIIIELLGGQKYTINNTKIDRETLLLLITTGI